MKKSSDLKTGKRSAAMNCLLVNQFATPGLGSLMGKRYVEGAIQLFLAVVGCGMALLAFMRYIWGMFGAYGASEPGPFPWYGKIGGILFVTAWLLSWITSVSLLRNAGPTEPPQPTTPVPPKLHD